MFSKDNLDVSQIFLAYLAFLGNETKVGIALKIPREVVEVLAAEEDWETKLKTYTALRHEVELPPTDQAICRTVTFIQACHLRDIIHRLLDRIHQNVDDRSLIEWMSPRDPRSNRPQFNSKILFDLTRALYMATRIIARAGSDKYETSPEGSDEKHHRSLYQAIERAMQSIDRLPGMDSVALANESLAKWKQTSDESHDDGKGK
jgi:hypothetical protein